MIWNVCLNWVGSTIMITDPLVVGQGGFKTIVVHLSVNGQLILNMTEKRHRITLHVNFTWLHVLSNSVCAKDLHQISNDWTPAINSKPAGLSGFRSCKTASKRISLPIITGFLGPCAAGTGVTGGWLVTGRTAVVLAGISRRTLNHLEVLQNPAMSKHRVEAH